MPDRVDIPQVSYVIRAEIQPDSGWVVGFMDIAWRNLSDDTLSVVYLNIGPSRYYEGEELDFHGGQADFVDAAGIHLDSVLYQNARLETKPVIEYGALRVTLPGPLYPGKIAPFIIAFRSQVAFDDQTVLTDWFPSVAVYRDGHPFRGWDDRAGIFDGESSDYTVTLVTDSSWMLIPAGEIFNEKEHYGTFEVSRGDTVFVDVLSELFAYSKDRKYEPVFEGGLKKYYVRLRNGNSFPVVVSKDVKLDRTYLDRFAVEVYYPSDVSDRWQRKAARFSREIVAYYQETLGEFPYVKAMIVADTECRRWGSRELVFVPAGITDDRVLHASLAVQIAKCWFADVVPVEESVGIESFDEGLAYYAAIKLLYDRFGADGYDMMFEYEDWCDRQERTHDQDRSDVYIRKVVPSRLHLLSSLKDDSVVTRMLADYADRHRFKLASYEDILNLIRESTGEENTWLIEPTVETTVMFPGLIR